MHTGAPPGAPRYRVMFTLPFQTAMSDSDIHRLRRVLGMNTQAALESRQPRRGRLDFFSGLFLLRSERLGEWRLEGRTWGAPAAVTVHDWHVVAADAARLVDPGVPVLARLAAVGSAGQQVRGPGAERIARPAHDGGP
jgi:hypothetical protein